MRLDHREASPGADLQWGLKTPIKVTVVCLFVHGTSTLDWPPWPCMRLDHREASPCAALQWGIQNPIKVTVVCLFVFSFGIEAPNASSTYWWHLICPFDLC